MSFRREKKFKLSHYEFQTLKNSLLNKGMQPLFKKRAINSLYYDTTMLDMFHDSEEGLLPRNKVRIRWYDNISELNIEIKTSSFEGRFKTSTICDRKENNGLPESIYDSRYGLLKPSLLVAYSREYFSLKNMRVTFDASIRYVNYRASTNIDYEDGEQIMEIKTSSDISDDYIQKFIPYATTRFSKYSRGILISRGEM